MSARPCHPPSHEQVDVPDVDLTRRTSSSRSLTNGDEADSSDSSSGASSDEESADSCNDSLTNVAIAAAGTSAPCRQAQPGAASTACLPPQRPAPGRQNAAATGSQRPMLPPQAVQTQRILQQAPRTGQVAPGRFIASPQPPKPPQPPQHVVRPSEFAPRGRVNSQSPQTAPVAQPQRPVIRHQVGQPLVVVSRVPAKVTRKPPEVLPVLRE